MNECRALSIQQPWAWAIMNWGKDIENRPWRTKYRGELYIHVPIGFDFIGCAWMLESKKSLGIEMPSIFDFKHCGIIGKVNLVDCVNVSTSPWFSGPYGLVLSAPEPVDFIPMRGKLGIFKFKLCSPKGEE